MKILHIIASADPRSGGPIEGILRQDEAMAGRASGELVTLDSGSADFLSIISMPVHAFGRSSASEARKSLIFRYGFSLNYIVWILRNARKFDAVIVHGLWNFSTFAASATLPFLRGVKYFVYTHGMMDPWFRRHYPMKHVLKVLSWLACEGRLLSSAKSVLFTTEDERELARGQFPFWRYSEAVVGYGTAQPPSLTVAQTDAFRAALPELGSRRYLLFLSRIHPKKGCDLLVEAFAAVAMLDPGLDIVIAGPDPDEIISGLRERALALGISARVHWPGMLMGDAKWGAYHGAEAFILPSHQENFGVVVAEALACGLPVLTTDKVNIWRDIVTDRVGFVSKDDVGGVRDSLEKWIATKPSSREEMRSRALISFAGRYDVRRAVSNLIARIGVETAPFDVAV